MNKFFAAAALAFAALFVTAPAQAQVPTMVNYQGRITVGTSNFNGAGQFKFVLTNGTGSTTYWSNDGTGSGGAQPAAAVGLTVANGLYSVLLGDTTLANMTAIPNSVFTNPDVRLRVWFNDGPHGFQQLTPDQRLAPNGYLPDSAISSNALAANAVTSTKIASGAVGSTQLAPNLALGGATTFSGDLNLAATTSAAAGVLDVGGNPFLHAYGANGITDANTFVGSSAGDFSLTGINNTAVGFQALGSNTTGSTNAASGARALAANTSGSRNTAFGAGALYQNLSAGQNVGIGNQALFNQSFVNGGTSWNSNNVAVGYQALYNNQPTSTANGIQNTALGMQALLNNATGANNIAIGYSAGSNLTTGSNNISVGNSGIAGESNTIRIGGTQTDTFLTGILHGNGTGLSGVALTAGGNIFTGTNIFSAGNIFSADQTFQGQIIASGTLGCLTLQNRANNAQVWQWRADATGLNCALFPGGSQPLTITPSGKVGIGTSTPSTTLEVSGEITSVAVNLTSDRNAKERFQPVSPRAVLDKVVRLPISEWQYKARENQPPDDARHIGPMAQDFREAFSLGHDEKHIASVDADGVALAAIQGLNELEQEKDTELRRLRAENQSLSKRLAAIESALGLQPEAAPTAP